MKNAPEFACLNGHVVMATANEQPVDLEGYFCPVCMGRVVGSEEMIDDRILAPRQEQSTISDDTLAGSPSFDEFLTSSCTLGSTLYVRISNLAEACERWFQIHGQHHISRVQIFRLMIKAGFRHVRRREQGAYFRYWEGLALKS
jgi:hypothetical protein